MHEPFHINPATGLLDGVRHRPSPNRRARPPETPVEALIVHCISLPPGKFGGDAIERLFCNRLDASEHPAYCGLDVLKVSAHFLVRRDGAVVQFVPVTECAWHAGESQCLGRTRVNEFSVGVELEGTVACAFKDRQYEVLAALTRALLRACPKLRRECIFGHNDIAPERKNDPGPHFDWARYRALIAPQPQAD